MITAPCFWRCLSNLPHLNQDCIFIDMKTEKPQKYKPVHHTVDGRLNFHISCPKINILSTGIMAVQKV